MLQIWVAKTPAEASCESPPNLVVNMGLVEADGMADCNTIIARDKGESVPIRPVTINANAGIIISLHSIIKQSAFL
jgi:hypothetical protein